MDKENASKEAIGKETKDKVKEIIEKNQTIESKIVTLVENSRKEFLKAFTRTRDRAKRQKINEIWLDMVSMWLEGEPTNAACLYAGTNYNTFKVWLRRYDEWASYHQKPYDMKDNPLRVLPQTLKRLQENKFLGMAETMAAEKNPTKLLEIQKYKAGRNKEEKEVKKEETKEKEGEARKHYEFDLGKLEYSKADLARIEETTKPASLKTDAMIRQAKAIHE